MPAASSPRRFSRANFWVHTILGLGLGAMMLALGLSGSILVFRYEIQQAMYPQYYGLTAKAQKIALDDAATIARAAAAKDAKLAAMTLPRTESDPIEFLFRSEQQGAKRVFVDPYTGNLLGTRGRDWLQLTYDFHHDLFVPGTGRTVLGVLGWALVLLCLTGLLVIWERRRAALYSLRNPAHFRSVHYLTGMFAVPLLLIIAFTATAFTWGRAYNGALRGIFSQPEQKPVKIETETVQIGSLDALLAAAQPQVSGARPTIMRLPMKPGDAASVRFYTEGDLREIGSNSVFLDAATAEVKRVVLRDQRTPDVRVAESFFPLHTGEFGGLFFRLLWFVAGLAPGFLFISGFVVWLRRNRPNDLPAIAAENAAEEPELVGARNK